MRKPLYVHGVKRIHGHVAQKVNTFRKTGVQAIEMQIMAEIEQRCGYGEYKQGMLGRVGLFVVQKADYRPYQTYHKGKNRCQGIHQNA
jgi:hypothetical protein